MNSTLNAQPTTKLDEDRLRYIKRLALKELNGKPAEQGGFDICLSKL
jgi:hypothetical protein